MGALVGLGFGLGLLLIWASFALPHQEAVQESRPGRMAQLLARAGMGHVSPGSLIALCAGCGAIAFVVVQAVAGAPPIAAAFAVMGGYLPIALVRRRAAKRQAEFAEVWPDAVDNLASAVRAGMSLPDALAALGRTGPEALRPDFEQFGLDYQVTGRFQESLDQLKVRLADPVGDRVVEGLRIAREVGGGELGRLLRNLSGYLRDDARTRSEMESRQAWTINGARLAVAAPWVVLLLMATQTGSMDAYSSTLGVVVLAIGGAMCAVAYWLMMRIGRLPRERRILA